MAQTQQDPFKFPNYIGHVMVPRATADLLISKDEATLKYLQELHGVLIKFPNRKCARESEKISFRIIGIRDRIIEAQSQIYQIMMVSAVCYRYFKKQSDHYGNTEIAFFSISARKKGLIIGTGGKAIKRIIHTSGAHVQFYNDSLLSPCRKKGYVRGSEEQIKHALK